MQVVLTQQSMAVTRELDAIRNILLFFGRYSSPLLQFPNITHSQTRQRRCRCFLGSGEKDVRTY